MRFFLIPIRTNWLPSSRSVQRLDFGGKSSCRTLALIAEDFERIHQVGLLRRGRLQIVRIDTNGAQTVFGRRGYKRRRLQTSQWQRLPRSGILRGRGQRGREEQAEEAWKLKAGGSDRLLLTPAVLCGWYSRDLAARWRSGFPVYRHAGNRPPRELN